MTAHYYKCHFGDAWTPGSSSFLFEIPEGESAWLANGTTAQPANDAANFDSRPDDAWVLISSDGKVAVVSVEDGVALILERPNWEGWPGYRGR